MKKKTPRFCERSMKYVYSWPLLRCDQIYKWQKFMHESHLIVWGKMSLYNGDRCKVWKSFRFSQPLLVTIFWFDVMPKEFQYKIFFFNSLFSNSFHRFPFFPFLSVLLIKIKMPFSWWHSIGSNRKVTQPSNMLRQNWYGINWHKWCISLIFLFFS